MMKGPIVLACLLAASSLISPRAIAENTATSLESTKAMSKQTAKKDKVSSSSEANIQALLDAKSYTQALSEIEFALKGNERNVQLLTLKCFALRELGKHESAIQSCIDALKIDPKKHHVKELLTIAYLRIGEVKPAQQLYKELKKDAPSRAVTVKKEADKLGVKL